MNLPRHIILRQQCRQYISAADRVPAFVDCPVCFGIVIAECVSAPVRETKSASEINLHMSDGITAFVFQSRVRHWVVILLEFYLGNALTSRTAKQEKPCAA